jgi:predicted ester cyclase
VRRAWSFVRNRSSLGLRIAVENCISEKAKVVVSRTISGAHKREFRGNAATEMKINIEGITIIHVANGKIRDSCGNLNYLGMMQQLGAAPVFIQPKNAAAR